MRTARCKRCLLPERAPGAALDAESVCAFCRAQDSTSGPKIDEAREHYANDLEAALRDCRGHGQYDALVCLSGGKDSLYLLHRLHVDYGLNVLAFTTDVNIPDIAWANIRRTIGKLGCDHLVYRPPDGFYQKLFSHVLKNQEERGAVYTVSYVYAPLFEGDALRIATEKGIPLILAGYSPGQPEPERMVYEFPRRLLCETDWTPPALKDVDLFTASDLARFWNPGRYPAGTRFPRYLAPLHAWPYDQDVIMKKVVDLGLAASSRHASPLHSNYPINWLLMYSDIRTFGYNPYAPEFSTLIREGKANYNYWRVMAPVVDFLIRNRLGPGREVTRSLRWLNLDVDDLRVTLPRGAYDPVPPN